MGKCNDPEYHRNYYLKNRERLIAQERERYYRLRLDPEFREARKREREITHFGTSRESIFARSDGKCVDCGKKATIVHHLDGDGRTNERLGLPPGKAPDRLVGLCRACHVRRHYPDLLAARMAAIARRWAFHYDACLGCGTTEVKHCGRGYCNRCHKKLRRAERAQEPGV
jgi:hypothetical protein